MTTILVIDDDPHIALLLQAIEPGWTIHAAPDGISGLDLARRFIAENQMPDLVVLDIDMPGLDGFDTCLLLRDIAPDAPIVPFTNLRNDRRVPRYMSELRCALPIYKGVSPTLLSQGMRIALKHRAGHPLLRDAVFERLLEKAVEAEAQARTQRAAMLQVTLFATAVVERLGLQQLLHTLDGVTTTVVETDEARLSSSLRSRPITILVAPSSDYSALLGVRHDLSIPTLFIAGTLKDANELTQFTMGQSTPALGVIVADHTFAQMFAEAARALTQGISYVDPRLRDASQQLIASAISLRLLEPLPPRLAEVVMLDLLGMKPLTISERLQITPASLRVYWRRVYEQLDLDRVGVRRWAQEQIASCADLGREFRQLYGEAVVDRDVA
jgi:DNA-binding NarL/FixJ family response regulator